MPWKPEIAPQAIVTNSSGMMPGVPSGTSRVIAGAIRVGWKISTAPYSRVRPTKSCSPLM